MGVVVLAFVFAFGSIYIVSSAVLEASFKNHGITKHAKLFKGIRNGKTTSSGVRVF